MEVVGKSISCVVLIENRHFSKLEAKFVYIKQWGYLTRTIYNPDTKKHERRNIETRYTSNWPIVIKPEWSEKEIMSMLHYQINLGGKRSFEPKILDVIEYDAAINWGSCIYDE